MGKGGGFKTNVFDGKGIASCCGKDYWTKTISTYCQPPVGPTPKNTKSPANFHPPGFLIYPIPFPQFFTGKKLYSFP